MKGVQQPMGGMRMIKLIRLISLALMLCMLAGFAAADDLTTSVLPACYQFVLVGAARVYASEPVDVRSQPESDAEIVGQVKPEQQVHVEEVDQESGMTFIFYYEDGRLPGWDAEDAITGWIPTDHLFNMVDYKTLGQLMVVRTNKPGNRLNLRSEPTAGSGSKGKYYAGTIVRVIDAGSNGFAHVQIGNAIGYMQRSFLTDGLYTHTAELPVLTVDSQYGDGLMIYEKPNEKSQVIQIAPDGDEVTILCMRRDKWYQVCYLNVIGYARTKELMPRLYYKK